MSDNNKTLFENFYKAFGERDFEGALQFLSDDFVWHAADNSPLADMSPYRGIEELRTKVFGRIEQGFERLEVVTDEIFEAGDRVVVLGYYLGRFRGKSQDFRAQVAHIWTVRNGKATEGKQYLDTLAVANEAAG